MAASVIKGLGKLAIVGGALYVTVEHGVWSGSHQSANTFNKLTQNLTMHDDYLKQVPSVSDTSSLVKTSWNSGVQTVCSSVANSPEIVSGWTKQLVSSVFPSEDDK
ncbi:hypothetical protein BSL78_13807 [Apostichopus japonicus]|uniref:MICOS complex subunit MIC13 n=1 Tax=Stichopus japonicus TaxID=307972 RepID=A0A2G8KMQ3_STIJA|nr:hypothetical protein BSL78_13807 [Apostichopus japonicus]